MSEVSWTYGATKEQIIRTGKVLDNLFKGLPADTGTTGRTGQRVQVTGYMHPFDPGGHFLEANAWEKYQKEHPRAVLLDAFVSYKSLDRYIVELEVGEMDGDAWYRECVDHLCSSSRAR